MTDEKLRELIRDFYDLEACGTGGPLHVVLDDYNLEDETIRECLEHMDDPTWGGPWPSRVQELARELGEALLAASMDQRARAFGFADEAAWLAYGDGSTWPTLPTAG